MKSAGAVGITRPRRKFLNGGNASFKYPSGPQNASNCNHQRSKHSVRIGEFVTAKRRNGKAVVKAIPSSEPAARDEGPRLIPLRSDSTETPMSHYLQLADTALGTSPKPAREKKKAAAAIGSDTDDSASE